MVNADFLDLLLKKYASNCTMHITDNHTRILASTDSSRVGMNSRTAQYIAQIMRPAVIESDEDSEAGQVIYGTPVFLLGGELHGIVVVHGQSAAVQQGTAARVALESAMEYEQYSRSLSNTDERGRIAQLMLSDKVDEEELISLMNRQEIDPALLRSVICISLQFHKNSYFNINLSLGYQSSIEVVRKDVADRLATNRYLNTQDLVFVYDRNTIVVIKSFIATSDYSRIYLSLDKICQEFDKDLSTFSAFSYNIAYGNLYSGVVDLKKSFEEAGEIISIGQKTGSNERLFILENILFDNIYHYLHPQILNKLLVPNMKKLEKKDGEIRTELLDCAEAFVGNCMNISATSEKSFLHRNTIRLRLERLRDLTGLDPAKNLRDAFIIKMLAIHLRQSSGYLE